MTYQPENSKDIILRILAGNPSLQEVMHHIQPKALTEAESQLLAQLLTKEVLALGCFIKWHIPTSKFERAKNHVLEMAKPFRGFNCYASVGGWLNSEESWEIEDIQLVTCFASFELLNKHFLNILMGSYYLGKAIEESAIGLEIGFSMQTVMLIIPTK